jgi:hypothetical protein
MTTRPGYYNAGDHDLIAHWLHTGKTDALMGNIQKYVERAGQKGPALPDLLKAREYLDRWIEFEEAKNVGLSVDRTGVCGNGSVSGVCDV